MVSLCLKHKKMSELALRVVLHNKMSWFVSEVPGKNTEF